MNMFSISLVACAVTWAGAAVAIDETKTTRDAEARPAGRVALCCKVDYYLAPGATATASSSRSVTGTSSCIYTFLTESRYCPAGTRSLAPIEELEEDTPDID